MRTSTGGEQTILQAAFRKTYYRVTHADATATPQDLTNFVGHDWVSDVTIDEDIDQPVAGCTINLFRQLDIDVAGVTETISLAPLRSDSSANATGPAIGVNRATQVYMAVVTGSRPINASTDWKLKFDGYSDTVEFAGALLKITCRDTGGALVDQLVNPSTGNPGNNLITRPDQPLSLEAVINRILTFAVVGGGGVTAYLPTAVSYAVVSFPLTSESVMSAAQRAAGLTAADFRYSWDEGTSAYRPTLNVPVRTSPVSAWTYPRSNVVQFSELGLDRLAVRNRITVNYKPQNAANGQRSTVFVADGTSETAYGVRQLLITEDDNSDINTAAKATNMATLILADLKEPKAQGQIEILPDWRVELFDYVTFAANVYFDTAQSWAVVAIRHELTPEKQRTILTVRGTPSAAYERWLARARTLGPEYVLTDADNGLSAVAFTEAGDGSTRTWTWTRGFNVAFVWFYEFVALAPVTASPFPDPASVATLSGATSLGRDINTYIATKPPRGSQRFAIAVPYYISGGTYVQGAAVKFTLDPAPSAMYAAMAYSGTGATIDLSLTVAAGVSDFPLTVDVFKDNPTATALATGTTSVSGTIDKTTTGFSALGAVASAVGESHRFFVRLTNVAGEQIWGAPLTVDRIASDIGQASVAVAFDGSWTWAEDGPTVQASVRYAESTSAFPSDGTAAAGTVINGRQVGRSGGTPLAHGTEIFVTIIPYDTAGGTGNALPSLRIRGSYQANAIAQGTVSIDPNGAWSWSVDGPPNQASVKYAESTSAFPADATALAGTSIVGRQVNRTGGGTLAFGDTVFVTVVPIDTNGNALPSIRLRATRQTNSASKTTLYGPLAWIMDPNSLTPRYTYGANQWINCVSLGAATSGETIFKIFATLPSGVLITGVSIDIIDNGAVWVGHTGYIQWTVERLDGNTQTVLGQVISTQTGGAQTLSISISETTSATRSYLSQTNLDIGIPSHPVNAGELQLGNMYITYTPPTPDKNV